MATSEFSVFGTGPGAYVYAPATWAANPIRNSGFPPGQVLKEQLNTPIRQASSIATMIASFMAAHQGSNVLDDGNLAVLRAQFEAALSSYVSGNSTHYQLVSPTGTLATRTVTLGAGVWQMVLTTHMTFVDPGNYDFMATQQASVVGALVNMSTTPSYRVVRGGGAGFGRSIFPTIRGSAQMTVVTPESFTMTIDALTSAGFSTCMGSVLDLEKIG